MVLFSLQNMTPPHSLDSRLLYFCISKIWPFFDSLGTALTPVMYDCSEILLNSVCIFTISSSCCQQTDQCPTSILHYQKKKALGVILQTKQKLSEWKFHGLSGIVSYFIFSSPFQHALFHRLPLIFFRIVRYMCVFYF